MGEFEIERVAAPARDRVKETSTRRAKGHQEKDHDAGQRGEVGGFSVELSAKGRSWVMIHAGGKPRTQEKMARTKSMECGLGRRRGRRCNRGRARGGEMAWLTRPVMAVKPQMTARRRQTWRGLG